MKSSHLPLYTQSISVRRSVHVLYGLLKFLLFPCKLLSFVLPSVDIENNFQEVFSYRVVATRGEGVEEDEMGKEDLLYGDRWKLNLRWRAWCSVCRSKKILMYTMKHIML